MNLHPEGKATVDHFVVNGSRIICTNTYLSYVYDKLHVVNGSQIAIINTTRGTSTRKASVMNGSQITTSNTFTSLSADILRL